MECPVCASAELRALATPRRRFERCDACGFARAAPDCRPTARAARERYGRHRNSLDDPGYAAYLAAVIAAAAEASGLRRGRVVDWGSGPTPALTELLRRSGYDAVAWDPIFAPLPPPAGRFDLAFCVEVAEHFAEPLPEFAALAAALAPGGWAAVHTHPAPADDAAFLRWWYIEDATHLSFYTHKAMVAVAAACGLDVAARPTERLWLLRKPPAALGADR